MITNKKNTDDADINKKEVEKSSDGLPPLLKRNLKSLIKNAEKHGLSKKDLIKIIGSE
jgi:ribosomal protein L22